MDSNMIGPALVLGLSAIGSCIGCGVASLTSHAVMSRVEEGHGKFIAMAAFPSSQLIYGFILMLMMARAIQAGTLTPITSLGIGVCSGLAIMFSAIYTGKVAAAGIQATAKKPAVYGLCFAALGIIDSFALFVFVFSLLLF